MSPILDYHTLKEFEPWSYCLEDLSFDWDPNEDPNFQLLKWVDEVGLIVKDDQDEH